MKRARIVLIEDHQLFSDLLISVLQGSPAFAIVGDFATAADGIRGCLQLNPDLAIVDCLLPDGSGLEIVRALKPYLAGTRFLLISSVEKDQVVREAIRAGVHGFVMKRAPYEVLLEAIHSVVAGRSYYCPTSSRLLVESLREDAIDPIDDLTRREQDILRGLARGDSIKVIASRHHVSTKTVHNQCGHLKEKLGIFDAMGLVRYAIKHGLAEGFPPAPPRLGQ